MRPGRSGAWVLVLLGGVACSKGPDVTAAAKPPAAAVAPAQAGPTLCEHQVPADLCTRCTPELTAVFQETGDWCAEHGVPESQCLQCNPELTFTAQAEPKDWCKEHGVPESKCTLCHPDLVAKFIQAGDYCREHRFPQSVCPICDPTRVTAAGEQIPPYPAPGTRVRLASAETVRDVGIQTAPAQRRRFARTLEVVGQLSFNRNRLAQLSARGEALVLEAMVDVGDEVKKGQPLLILASAAVGSDQAQLGSAQARLRVARSRLERETSLVDKGLTSRTELEEAEREFAAAQAEHSAARGALTATGASGADATGRYTLVAPFAGTVVARDAVAGKRAGVDQVLLELADLSTMWAQLEVPEAEAGEVRPGQTVRLTLDARQGEVRDGVVARVAASVDPQSRTVAARVELPNPDRSLKAGSFLRGRIMVAAEHDALMIPTSAIQRAEGRTLVFLHQGGTVYLPVAVELGARDGERTEVLKGLEPGASVVTTGAFLLKTELLKDSIGAGCCETGEE